MEDNCRPRGEVAGDTIDIPEEERGCDYMGREQCRKGQESASRELHGYREEFERCGGGY